MLYRTSCCGVRDFHGLEGKSPKEIYNEILSFYKVDGDGAHFILTANRNQETALENFINYVTKNELGKIVQTNWAFNPNSGNELKAVFFTPDRQKSEKKKKSITGLMGRIQRGGNVIVAYTEALVDERILVIIAGLILLIAGLTTCIVSAYLLLSNETSRLENIIQEQPWLCIPDIISLEEINHE